MDITARTQWIKERAKTHGFAFAGVARAENMEPETERLREWLDRGYHAKMSYMEHHFPMRTDPRELVPGAKSVISLMYNYYNPEKQGDPDAPMIAMYAYGEDYHKVIRRKLKVLLKEIRAEFGDINGRCFVDSGPVMERDWAKRAGIGWTGKNTLLINPKAGSYFFLAELIIDLELQPDQPISDHCGTCTRCIEACPTDAIAQDGYVLDAGKCISYLTIELRDEAIPDAFEGKMENWVFGCDICQQVCPWNRFSTPHTEPAFEPSDRLMHMHPDDWNDLSEEAYDELFGNSPVKRTGYKGLRRNLEFVRQAADSRQTES